MVKNFKTLHECGKCGAQFLKWQGQCTECGAWGTVSQSEIDSQQSTPGQKKSVAGELVDFGKIQSQDVKRLKTGTEEFDQVLGGGIVPGSLVLVGGEPGIGKSTLILQIAAAVARISAGRPAEEKSALYVSGEESAEQIKMRLDRLALDSSSLKFLGETDIGKICATIDKYKPALAIIDSIQTMYAADIPSAAGSINQVRACTVKLLEQAKRNNVPIFIVGHVTKEGMVAGPKTLEHLVDTVLYLEGDRYHHFRILRTVKNRFGSTNEVGIFEMRDRGLAEISNPSEVFLQERQEKNSGSVITAVMEGNRTFLVEVQALVSRTYYGYPQRKSSGFDLNRLELLIAVLSKRCGLKLGDQDILVNIAGGIRMNEPAVDLAVSLAVISAFKNRIIDPRLVAFGEVGLGGEVRPVSQPDKRINEAEKLGFKTVLMPLAPSAEIKDGKIKVMAIKNLAEALEVVKKGEAAVNLSQEE